VSEQLIGVWVIVCDELHIGIHGGGDKREIAGEAVKLGNDPWLFVSYKPLVPALRSVVSVCSRSSLRAIPDGIPDANPTRRRCSFNRAIAACRP
jgi:hypothetical protein